MPSKSVTSTSWKVPPMASATSLPFDCGRSRMATLGATLGQRLGGRLAEPGRPADETAFFPAISIWLPFQKVLNS